MLTKVISPPTTKKISDDPFIKMAKAAFNSALNNDRPDVAKIHQQELYRAIKAFEKRRRESKL